MASKLILAVRAGAPIRMVSSCTATMRIARSYQALRLRRFGLTPIVRGDVEHDAVDVFEFLFRVDARIARQLHEEFAAVVLDFGLGRRLVLDHEADVMQA